MKQQTIGEGIEKVFAKSKLNETLIFNRIVNNWQVIIGESLVKVSKPLYIRNKCLYIGVNDASYAQHLLYFQEQLLGLLASPYICGEDVITNIKFRVTSTKITKQNKQKPILKNTQLQKQHFPEIKTVTQTIQNTQIRQSFSCFMLSVLQKNRY